MGFSQVFVLVFGLAAVSVTIWAMIVIALSMTLGRKPLWFIASLFGFVGFGTEWSSTGDLILLFGIQIPVVHVFTITSTGVTYIKAMLPVGAIAALISAPVDAPGEDAGLG